jgi:hypothetical protein
MWYTQILQGQAIRHFFVKYIPASKLGFFIHGTYENVLTMVHATHKVKIPTS